jgi:hypothetical protein
VQHGCKECVFNLELKLWLDDLLAALYGEDFDSQVLLILKVMICLLRRVPCYRGAKV